MSSCCSFFFSVGMTQFAYRKSHMLQPHSPLAVKPLTHSTPPAAAKPSWRQLLPAPGLSVPTRRRSAINAVWAETRAWGCSAGPAQVMPNLFMDLDTLAEHSPVKCRKYIAVLSVLIQEFENGFQDCGKNHQIWVYLCLHFPPSAGRRPTGKLGRGFLGEQVVVG